MFLICSFFTNFSQSLSLYKENVSKSTGIFEEIYCAVTYFIIELLTVLFIAKALKLFKKRYLQRSYSSEVAAPSVQIGINIVRTHRVT